MLPLGVAGAGPPKSEASAKLSLFLTALVAQWIEQEPSNLLVAGSIPAEGASLGGVEQSER